jgi:hypothetical protein
MVLKNGEKISKNEFERLYITSEKWMLAWRQSGSPGEG